MSSYSYMVVPTCTAAPFNTDKGKTLSTFVNYFLCTGQQKADILGYSPLPKNLVEAGFKQVKRIPGAVSVTLDQQVQQPRAEHPPVGADARQVHEARLVLHGLEHDRHHDQHLRRDDEHVGHQPERRHQLDLRDLRPSGTPGSTGSGSPGAGSDPGGGGAVDPLTGAPAGDTVTSADGSGSTAAAATPVSLAAARTGQTHLIGWLVAAMLALTVLLPPFLISRHARRSP